MNHLLSVILGAGQGKRMNSAQPKLLQSLGGQPMIFHLLQTLGELQSRQILVYGHQGELLKNAVQSAFTGVEFVEQKEQLGTGHAVLQALPFIEAEQLVLILLGDTPLISKETLSAFIAEAQNQPFTLLTAKVHNPFGLGRIIRENGRVTAIVEEKDATPEQRQIQEISTGMMAIKGSLLQKYLPALKNNNAQKEYYLTDVIAMAVADGYAVEAFIAPNPQETQGINDRIQLAQAEQFYRQRQTEALLKAGVTLVDPNRVDIHGVVTVGRDVYIEPNVIFKGKVVLGDRVRIEANTIIENSVIGSDTEILSHSRIEDSVIGQSASIGPFARLRPKTVLADKAKVGNFVELKAVTLGLGSKVNHLSYLGDAVVGESVNIGAGTITCNYDGANKHKTVIGSGVFVGSNSALVAPIVIGNEATIGAGSTVRHNVPEKALFFTFGTEKEKNDWQRPQKEKKEH